MLTNDNRKPSHFYHVIQANQNIDQCLPSAVVRMLRLVLTLVETHKRNHTKVVVQNVI